MLSSTLIVAASACLSFSFRALVAAAQVPPTFTVSSYAGSATGFPYVGRDGGGGGVLNGKNIMVFSDTTTDNSTGGFVRFSSNSYTFVPDPASNPLQLQDYGTDGIPEQAVPWWGDENLSDNFIWPNNPLTTQMNDPNATSAYAIYSVGKRTADGDGSHLYNTLCSLTASSDGLNTTRVVPQLNAINGVDYGGFATAAHTDNNLYLLGGDGNGGLKVARVPWDSAGETSQYTFYTGNGDWVSDYTSAVTVANTIGGAQYSSGDVFWSPFYNTWLIIALTTFMNQFYIQYSKSGHIVGPYSDSVELYKGGAEACCNSEGQEKGNYAGHAYPQWLGTEANEVILSWTYNGSETQMALVTFS